MSNNGADFSIGGQVDGPGPMDNYKRAVFRTAPTSFSVEFLPPTKQGGNYSYGMRISSISRGDKFSISSRGSHSEYEVWRRWEDCLWFQQSLELEYTRAARERKKRLQQGKGVKNFEGFYKQDMASSWESLPPGPDPTSVAKHLHDVLPTLSKKGTIFRASQATVNQRYAEFKAFIEALLRDDMPTLIQEIRSTRLVTDFFGYWRRDYDLTEKVMKNNLQHMLETPRSSVTSSVFSSYFSPSHSSLHDSLSSSQRFPHSLSQTPERRTYPTLRTQSSHMRPHSMATTEVSDSGYSPSICTTIVQSDTVADSSHHSRRRALSGASSDSSSTHSEGSSDGSAVSSGPVIADEFPIIFGHNPNHQARSGDYTGFALEGLPEDGIFGKEGSSEYITALSKKGFHHPTRDRSSRRTCQIYVSPVHTPDSQHSEFTITEQRPDLSIRESWQSTASNATILQGLGLALRTSDSHRMSVASVDTFMTTDSALAVLRSPSAYDETHSIADNRASIPVTLSSFEMFSEIDDDESYILDQFPRPASYVPEPRDSRPETPHSQTIGRTSSTIAFPTTPESEPPSPTTSTAFSVSAWSVTSSPPANAPSLSIKAAHNNAIIILRAPRDISFADVRLRIYNKFVGQEGVPLSRSFTVALAIPMTPAAQHPLDSEQTVTNFIDSQPEWERIVASTNGNKISLRILDTP